MATKRVILISGKKRSGKDTVSKMLKHLDPSIKIISFAAPLKQIIADTFDIPYQELDDWKNADRYLVHNMSPEDDTSNMTYDVQSYRQILQNFGTEAMKKSFGKDVWSHKAYLTIMEYFQFTDTVIISDWRFIEEYEYLFRALPHTTEIMTTRISTLADNVSIDPHSSENELDDYKFSITIENTGTLYDLTEKVAELYAKL